MSDDQQPLPIGNESAAQAAMNDTASGEEIDARNQMQYHAQMDDNMNVEPYDEEKETLIQDNDDAGGFFSFKTIMVIIAILFFLLAIYYFFFRKSGGGGGGEDFEGDGGSIGGEYDE